MKSSARKNERSFLGGNPGVTVLSAQRSIVLPSVFCTAVKTSSLQKGLMRLITFFFSPFLHQKSGQSVSLTLAQYKQTPSSNPQPLDTLCFHSVAPWPLLWPQPHSELTTVPNYKHNLSTHTAAMCCRPAHLITVIRLQRGKLCIEHAWLQFPLFQYQTNIRFLNMNVLLVFTYAKINLQPWPQQWLNVDSTVDSDQCWTQRDLSVLSLNLIVAGLYPGNKANCPAKWNPLHLAQTKASKRSRAIITKLRNII